ncbi:hypothetical protein PHET_09909 [Paragonimus heterotremus]|uniref:Uncharacterized protein n=1 Tax=Paragonimus heterotremus TaxID=100268 RepID=A0A8J4SS26_9TREM|nr:hypothetical protein PHET_09909 [Paragonimus heterotremus]
MSGLCLCSYVYTEKWPKVSSTLYGPIVCINYLQNCSKRIPLSDAWLEEVQSEESDSEFSRPSDLGKKAKLTHDWTVRDITSDEEDTDEFDDEDDADDEDWTVPDYEKKVSLSCIEMYHS